MLNVYIFCSFFSETIYTKATQSDSRASGSIIYMIWSSKQWKYGATCLKLRFQDSDSRKSETVSILVTHLHTQQ